MNSLILKYRGKQTERTAEYLHRRAQLRTIQCAMASFELSSKAWHTATLDMGRNMELLCDALRALHNTNDLSAVSNESLTSSIVMSAGVTTVTASLLQAKEEASLAQMRDVIAEVKRESTAAFQQFITSMKQRVTSPLFTLISEMRECDNLRHTRNRLQEQFDVDDSTLERKQEEYMKKGRPLSESKTYADLAAKKANSQEALERADAQFDVAYRQLVEESFCQTRRNICAGLAESAVTLFGALQTQMKGIYALSTESLQSRVETTITTALSEAEQRGRAAVAGVVDAIEPFTAAERFSHFGNKVSGGIAAAQQNFAKDRGERASDPNSDQQPKSSTTEDLYRKDYDWNEPSNS